MKRTGVILINTGTPDGPSTGKVRPFLAEFLCDKRIIDLPTPFRQLLVRALIVPLRSPKSAGLYRKLWTDRGSPLLHYSTLTRDKLQAILGDSYRVILGMRYGNPSLKGALKQLEKEQVKEIVVVPLYPHYASATTGSALELVLREIGKWNSIPRISTVADFYNQPEFLDAFVNRIRPHLDQAYDHVLFSYHGLPLKQVFQSHDQKSCEELHCTSGVGDHNRWCYQAACYQTTRLLSGKLGLAEGDYTTCFQSRFSRNWLSPFTDEVIRELADAGVKRLLVVSPSFVSDCLETVVEIGQEYQKLLREHNGGHLQLVESLNEGEDWIRALKSIILNRSRTP